MDRNIDPGNVYSRIKTDLEKRGFKITSEDIRDGYWDLHAKKSGLVRIATGSVRDVDLILSGDRRKLAVQLHAGIWGRDFLVPAIEGVATFGAAAAAEVLSSRGFEEELWQEIVKDIDPTLLVCDVDGRVFASEKELQDHQLEHEQNERHQVNMMNMSYMGWV